MVGYCDHYEYRYQCKICKKSKRDCTHKDHVTSSWYYVGDKLENAGGVCWECGKNLKLNKERTAVE